jgi:murein tripeptide amidase MpaA
MIVQGTSAGSVSLAAVILVGAGLMASAQTPSTTLDPATFLPPAPAWSGASEKLVAPATDQWVTPAETTGLTASPTYDETVAFLKRIDEASSLVRLETFGTTPQGRSMIAAVVSKDGRRLSRDKPLFLIQAGIHSGEIDGKDAGLMLIRDICFRGREDLIDKVNILFVPVFNVDGHERSTAYSRPNQRGPVVQGWRNTAQNLNLNRDYMKADSPEMRAMLGLIVRYDPDFYIDLHVTDGMDYQYDITFGFDGWDGRYADSPAIGRWLDEVYRPRANAALKANGHIPGPLIFARDETDISKGIDLGAFAPRFSNPYGDLRRLPSVLVENHSLKPYRQRVLGTYVLLESTLATLASEGARLKSAIAADRALRPTEIDANWKADAEPLGMVDFLPIEGEEHVSPVSGATTMRWTGKAAPPLTIPVFGSEPGLKLSVARAYWVPATKPEVIARLAAHGVTMETIREPRAVEVDMIRFAGFTTAAPSEGRVPMTATGLRHERRTEVYPPGSVRVSTDHPLGALVAYLLEPESDDSFFAWGFFAEILHRVEYMEPYAIAPMAERMLESDPRLKAEFDRRLKEDAEFAASPGRRLQFFYERSPFTDARYLLYPVGRET